MILSIVQARMSSTRLPFKVMKEVLGKPLIGYVFERLAYSKRINKIILATSRSKENDPLARYVKDLGFEVYRGSEEDVLERFYYAATGYKPQTVVRVTADTPLIDPKVCDRLIDFFLRETADYACLGKTFAEGVDCEVFSYSALVKAYQNSNKKSEREHVTPYIYNHPHLFKKVTMENKTDDSRWRFTVDEQEDFEVVNAIMKALYEKDPIFSLEEIKEFLTAHPNIAKKNVQIIRNEGYLKSLKEDSMTKS